MLLIRSRKVPQFGGDISGAIVLYASTSSTLPIGWSVYAPAKGVFVRGAPTISDINTSTTGSYSHTHSNAANTDAAGIHNHSGGATIGASSTKVVFPYASGYSTAGAGHGHSKTASVANNTSTHSHTISATNSSEQIPDSKKYYWIKSSASKVMPIGGIIIWSGSVVSLIPEGWHVCDGAGGTVDLRDMFVYGAYSDSDVSTTVGGGGHSHTNPNTGDDGSHSHVMSVTLGSAGSGSSEGVAAGTSTSSTGHKHSDSDGSTSASGIHAHTIPTTNSSETTPPYVVLFYIQKIL